MTVEARVWSEREYRELLLVIDTGASITSLEPAILQGLGYSPRDAILRTRVPSPAGVQRGQLFRVPRFNALGFELPSFVVQSLALNDEYGVDGLLGMNFLDHYNFTVRPQDGEIELEPVALTAA
jgi:predicted aspartyl protease